MREIVLDTETTGLDPAQGHKIVEIGCVELINHTPTGRTFQEYLNPERLMDEDVIAVHGITNEFVKDKPTFKEVVDKFIEFIGEDSKLVIHNAAFDMKFLNAELESCGYPKLSYERVIDTLIIARQKFPGSRVNLNELCKRFNVDASARTVHGALLDSELLAEVYLELIGGREPGLVLATQEKKEKKEQVKIEVNRIYHEPRSFPATDEELLAHEEFLKKIPNHFWGDNL
jgi:DNA polymerase-3 subunit epsilon